MKGLCKAILAILVIAACGRDGGITEPTPRDAPLQPGVLAIGTDPVSGASIETNKDDYSPGEVVHLVGRGWAANETVNLHMTEQPNTHADVDTNVVADASGGFSLHFYDVQTHDLGVTFTLTATGATSGSVAVATFYDNRNVDLVTFTPASPVSPSAPVSAAVRVVLNSGGGGANTWLASQWEILNSSSVIVSSSGGCVNTPNHSVGDADVVSGNKHLHSFNFTAPATPGAYTFRVRLYSTDTCGPNGNDPTQSDWAFSVVAPNTPPTAEANGPYSGPTNSNIALSGVGSTDAGGSITTYAWTYSVVSAPGGSCSIANASSNSPTGATISCTQNGTYEVKLTVTDNLGATDDDVASLTVSNTAPTANAGGPYNPVAEGSSLTLNGSGNDTDGSITGYLWSSQPVTADPGADCTIVNQTQATASISCDDDGTFQVKLTVTDDDGQTGEATVNITVTNVAPSVNIVQTGLTIDEGGTATYSATFTDPGANDTHSFSWTDNLGPCSLNAGATANSATFLCTDNASGIVKLQVTDDDGDTGEDTAGLTANNVAPTVNIIENSKTINEGGSATFTATFSDPGSSDTHTFSWTDDLTPCTLNGGSTANSATFTCTDNGSGTVKLQVTDDDGDPGEDTAGLTVNNVAPTVNIVETSKTINESGSATFTATFSDPGSSDTHTFSWTDDLTPCTLNAGSTINSATFTCVDNDTGSVKLTVTDDDNDSGEDTAVLNVDNVPPAIGTLTAPIDPVAVGPNNVTVTWTFTDPGADSWTCSIEWDTGLNFTSANLNVATKTCSATASLTPGLYSVRVKVADDDGGEDIETITAYIVVYDPNGGFVTGGGWINSLAGFYRLDVAAAGKANFGFVSKYQPGKSLPQGNTEFQFHAGNLNFKSTVYEWLVVAGTKAIYKGEGTIAGLSGVYGFLLSAIDGSPDKFRIKIWEKTSGNLVYDTLPLGAADDADPTTTLGGGSIVVHTKK